MPLSESQRAANQRWRERHPERIREIADAYKERRREISKAYRQATKEKRLAENRKYHRTHQGHISQRNKKWRADNPEKLVHQRVSRAIKRGDIDRHCSCEKCGATKNILGHHHDYSKPPEVVWMCHSCHYKEHQKLAAPRTVARDFPKIVCLCGSTRFVDAFFEAGWDFTLRGYIVLSIGVCKHVETQDGGHVAEALGPGVVERLDELHKRKIDLADEVFVLNVGKYIGESTRSEIEYAKAHGKPIKYLEEPDAET